MEFKSPRQLRTTVTKHALKAYVAGPFTSKYHICVVRLFFLDRVSNKNINNKKFTGKFFGAKSKRCLFFLLYKSPFREENIKRRTDHQARTVAIVKMSLYQNKSSIQGYLHELCLTGHNLYWLY